jgi:hypothetical protein
MSFAESLDEKRAAAEDAPRKKKGLGGWLSDFGAKKEKEAAEAPASATAAAAAEAEAPREADAARLDCAIEEARALARLLADENAALRDGDFATLDTLRQPKEDQVEALFRARAELLREENRFGADAVLRLEAALEAVREAMLLNVTLLKDYKHAVQTVLNDALSSVEHAVGDGTYRADGRADKPESLSLKGLDAKL